MTWNQWYRMAAITTAALGITGCVEVNSSSAPLDADSAIPHAVTYHCGSLGEVYIQYTDSDVIALSTQTDTTVLTGAESASGARYTGETMEFWTKKDAALLTVGDALYHCVQS